MKLSNVTFAQQVPVSQGYSLKTTAVPTTNGETFEVFASPDHFPWVQIKGTRGTIGVTTVFNIVGRAWNDSDTKAVADLAAQAVIEAETLASAKPVPQTKR